MRSTIYGLIQLYVEIPLIIPKFTTSFKEGWVSNSRVVLILTEVSYDNFIDNHLSDVLLLDLLENTQILGWGLVRSIEACFDRLFNFEHVTFIQLFDLFHFLIQYISIDIRVYGSDLLYDIKTEHLPTGNDPFSATFSHH